MNETDSYSVLGWWISSTLATSKLDREEYGYLISLQGAEQQQPIIQHHIKVCLIAK